ncbi:type III-A CRISPR-associated protein Csm2 [Avibacterium sp. 21-586]|uniref:type III-A CRISPR-associated protein Csm2 n=1 Tax=Avibacterium sp. 21-586 TaxID=2911534 RepID=UPI00224790C2|nr:type III-A CRISPR-associated protein Csm2 [Avibacterium sp. 21-586]MCW9710131.1 type III-A CRISPR-associated protein Csm2 [Avibacterium sp. 21-586]
MIKEIEKITFGAGKPATIFSDIADKCAKSIRIDENSERVKGKNKTTQIRKFYDELAIWNERVQQAKDPEIKFEELVPFIKMLKAKVAYAKGRDHIDQSFVDVFNKVIDQANDRETLRDAKLFMEAVIGYCKLYETTKN